MSNFSNIGFPVESEDEYGELIMSLVDGARLVQAAQGHYLVHEEPTGASLWIQIDQNNDVIGVNPHFTGPSRRTVGLIKDIDRPHSALDGALYGWANPQNPDDPADTGDYPFVFDLPDRDSLGNIAFPQTLHVQLAAFAGEIEVFASEAAYDASGGEDEIKYAAESFIPSGLFIPDDAPDGTPPEAYGLFTGTILSATEHVSSYKASPFLSMQVRTLGGDIDVVADRFLVPEAPNVGGIIQGSFWLSGQLIGNVKTASPTPQKKKRFGLF